MKKKNIFIGFAILLGLITLIKCNNDNIIEREYPIFSSVEISNINENGATFNANIDNLEKFNVIEYGFVWDNQDRKVITKKLNSSNFQANITTTLIVNYTYTVRAFIKTKDFLVYSDYYEFKSLGSNAAIISKIEPNTGIWGDTIKLLGENFSYATNKNIVKFKNIEAKVIKSTDTIITCIVPNNLKDSETSISITVANKEALSNEKFKTISPIINSFSPKTATFNDEITINGEYFSKKQDYNKVYFGNIPAEITYSDENTIKALVPEDIEFGSVKIKVQSHAVETIFNENFKLKTPVISYIDRDIRVKTEIIIKADLFNPIKEKNKILFDGNEAEIISINNKNIKVKVPLGPYSQRKFKVQLQVTDLIVEYSKDVNIIDQWMLISDDLPFRFNNRSSYYLATNNTIYLVAKQKSYTDNNDYLWKLNPSDFIWERIDIPNNIKVSNFISNGTNLYFYDGSNNSFFEFNPVTNIWSQKLNFPGIRRYGASQFVINNEVYIGKGSYTENYNTVYHKDFYKYNATLDTWTRIADLNYQDYSRRDNATTFVINGIAYLGNGASNTGMVDFWSYNPNSDSWNRIADFPDARNNSSAFSLNNYGYVTGGGTVGGGNENSCWQYNPITNNWKKLEKIKLKNASGIGGHFSFVLQGKAYIGAGVNGSGGSNVHNMYEFKLE